MKNKWKLVVILLFFSVNSFASSLSELQNIAVKNRKIIDKYKQNVEIAESDIRIAKSGYLPSIDAAYVLNSLNEDTWQGESKENSVITGSITYNLFAGFKDKYNIRSARQIRDAEQLQVESIIQDIRYSVALYFTDIYVKRTKVTVSEKTYVAYTQLYSDAQKKFDVGILNRSDLLKIKVEQDNAFINFERAKVNLDVSINELKRAIDNPLQADRLNFNNFLTIPKIKDIDQNKEIMFSNRSDIQMLKKLIAASNNQVNVARSSYYPSVNVSGIYKKYDDDYMSGNGRHSDIYEDELRVQLTMSINIFDGMAKNARVDKAKSNGRSVKYDLYELQLNLTKDLTNYYLDFGVSLRNLSVTETGIEQAKENLRIAKLSAEEGLITTSDLLDAVASLARAEMNNISAKSALFVSYFKIKRLIEKC